MERTVNKKYLGILGAWALSFGCSVGWGSFVMPGTTFLPIAGPVGTAVGLGLGGLVMFILALNFHYLMNRYPDCGGIYTYTKKAFGYDHGFLSAWFLIITYVAIIWANATALPLIARTVLGDTGSVILGIAALGAIFTGLIGNYIALSRLLCSLSDDGLFPKWFGSKTSGQVPKNAILCILGISLVLPFFGRTAISWIVDVTTVGATIAYALASASAFKLARQDKNTKNALFGLAGMVISVLFALEFLIPNLLSISTLSMESYLILTIWSILGFLYFRIFLHRDTERKMGHSILAWIVLLGLIIFTSSVLDAADDGQRAQALGGTDKEHLCFAGRFGG